MSELRLPGKRAVSHEHQRSIAETSLPEFNQATLAQLEAMGFPLIRCQKALLATGNSDPEVAMEWLFAHMEDPGELSIVSFGVVELTLDV